MSIRKGSSISITINFNHITVDSFKKGSFGNGYVAWGLPKNSRHLDVINRGLIKSFKVDRVKFKVVKFNRILELDAFGLSNYWKRRFTRTTTHCVVTSKADGNHGNRRLTLPVMSSTFVLHAIGCSLALLAFGAELAVARNLKKTFASIRVQ